MVKVYDNHGVVIAEVEVNRNLDFWDGQNYTDGNAGNHRGLTELQGGQYVLIFSSQWHGKKHSSQIISPRQAVQEIIRSGNINLFDRYSELQDFRIKEMLKVNHGPV